MRQKTGADMLIWNSSCVVHEEFKAIELREMRIAKPNAKVIAHPESPRGILEQADFIGSTTGLIDYVKKTEANVRPQGSASKATGTITEAKKPIIESNAVYDRMRQLAGLI